MSKYSENEDDPDVFESSGDEWKEEEEVKKNSRRSSTRLSKKPRKTVVEYGSSDDDSDAEPQKKKSKNGVAKKTKAKKVKDEDDDYSVDEDEDEAPKEKPEKTQNSETKVASSTTVHPVRGGVNRKFIPKTLYSEDYTTGSFVILKKDAENDASKHPCIWRIDGKALLQKYEAYDEDGKVRHKNTSIYTGWSPMDKDLYAPVTVDVIQHNNQNLKVELHWDKLKEINADSD